jgi:dipeptidyl aminopeptidase/acylaminoacyl peptidase
MTGEKDFNVPAIGSEQMYQALRSQDIPTELMVYPGQFHGFTQPSFIKDRLSGIINGSANTSNRVKSFTSATL